MKTFEIKCGFQDICISVFQRKQFTEAKIPHKLFTHANATQNSIYAQDQIEFAILGRLLVFDVVQRSIRTSL